VAGKFVEYEGREGLKKFVDGVKSRGVVSLLKILYGENAFEINDVQET